MMFSSRQMFLDDHIYSVIVDKMNNTAMNK